MRIATLHPDEPPRDTDDIAAMVAARFPALAGRPLTEVDSPGTDNLVLRLGDDLLVRLPRTERAVAGLRTELRYPPRWAHRLPAAVPVPVQVVEPDQAFPWPWAVFRWLPGRTPAPGDAGPALAADLARFVTALHAIEPPPPAQRPRSYRGGPLAARDTDTRAAIAACAELADPPDTALLARAWDVVRAVPEGDGQVWLHTDLQPGNLLVRDGRLTAVLDWGGLAVGDPAADLIVAWNLLDPPSRAVFREQVGAGEQTVRRGRAWALSIGLVAYPYYATSNPALAAVSRYQVEQVLHDLDLPSAWRKPGKPLAARHNLDP